MPQTAVNHSTFPVPGAAGSPLCITSCPVATALGQLLSCCAPLWGCGDSDWILLHPIAAFLPTCLYPFGTVLRREKPPSASGRKQYKHNGQSWHHWVACCTERGSRTEMAKPKQCPKRCLPYGAVLGIGCVGIAQHGLCPHGCRDGKGEHQRSSSAMSSLCQTLGSRAGVLWGDGAVGHCSPNGRSSRGAAVPKHKGV